MSMENLQGTVELPKHRTRVRLNVKVKEEPEKQARDLKPQVEALSALLEELRLINPNRHPVKSQVLERWVTIVEEVVSSLGEPTNDNNT